MADLRLLCWNVAGKVRRLPQQAARVRDLAPDLVCLQEVRASSAPAWAQELADAGLPHLSVAPLPPPGTAPGRALAVLTASRTPLRLREVAGAPWPERVLATLTAGGLEVVNVHSPISPKPELAKVRTHEAVHAHLAGGSGPRLLCGDLNTPRREHPDGRVWTFARDRYGRLRPDRGERWDAAELALIRGLEAYGFRDGFRVVHGPEVRELSWEWPRWGGGYRLDHLIVSAEVVAREVGYLHDWRREGLSDHSPLEARLEVAAPAASAPVGG